MSRSNILEGLHTQRVEFVSESAKNLEISKDITADDKKKYKKLLKDIDKLANYKSDEGILSFYVDKVTTPEQVWLYIYGFNREFEDEMEFERVWNKNSMEKSVKTLLNAFNIKDFTLWTSTYWNAKLDIKGKTQVVGPYVQVSFLPENVAESVNEGFYKKGKRYKTEDEMYFVVKKVNSDGTLLIYDEDVEKEYKAEISDIELLNPTMVKEGKKVFKIMHIKTTDERIRFDANTLDNTATKWFFTDDKGRYLSVDKKNAEILNEEVDSDN